MKKNKRIIIGGGGTGGHVFPAISIAEALKRKEPEVEILFVGAENKLEMEKVPEAGFKIEGLPVTGFQRKLSAKNLTFVIKLIRSMRKSAKIIASFKPDLAIGVGGYASGPILRVAARKKIPIAIQEQNSYAGVTNRMLAAKAKKIFVAYEGMEKYFPAEKILLTGNPVRTDLLDSDEKRTEGMRNFGLEEGRPVVLVIGGSLGSRTINNSILQGIENFGKENQLIWQTGKYYYQKIRKTVGEIENRAIKIQAFIRNMDHAFAVADVIISRAGAGTISELALIGKPVILVPSPNVAEDHQTKNAMALASREAAIHITDRKAETELVKTCLQLLNDEQQKRRLSKNIKKMALPDAADRIADELLKMI